MDVRNRLEVRFIAFRLSPLNIEQYASNQDPNPDHPSIGVTCAGPDRDNAVMSPNHVKEYHVQKPSYVVTYFNALLRLISMSTIESHLFVSLIESPAGELADRLKCAQLLWGQSPKELRGLPCVAHLQMTQCSQG